jgi:hypothetical protein
MEVLCSSETWFLQELPGVIMSQKTAFFKNFVGREEEKGPVEK